MVARKLGKGKLYLVGVQEVRWEKGGTEQAEDYTFLYGEGNDIIMATAVNIEAYHCCQLYTNFVQHSSLQDNSTCR
jgi:hypothetical protein